MFAPGGEMNQIKEAVHPAAGSRRWPAIWLYVVLTTLIAGAAWPANASGRLIAHNTPRYVFTAKNLGTEDPSKAIEVSIWLNRSEEHTSELQSPCNLVCR